MNKWLIGAAAALLLAGSAPAGAAALTSDDFADVRLADAAMRQRLDALLQAGIFEGVSEGTFGLQEQMNRAQFAKVAALILGLPVDTDLRTSSFTDVSADDAGTGYALPYIEALKNAGITEGVGANAFNPAGSVTKEQLAAFLVRIADVEHAVKIGPVPSGFQDPTVSNWALQYVAVALEQELMTTAADHLFHGKTNATRDVLATGAYETKKLIDSPPVVTAIAVDSGQELTITFNTMIDPIK